MKSIRVSAPSRDRAVRACERCGHTIATERLEALPRAVECFGCADLRKRPSRGQTCS